jgi:DNA-binding GntR family transcriptional regulator
MEPMRVLGNRPDLIDEVLAALRDAILTGSLAPEAPLAQEDLALRLGVSRQPVSHALVLLRREGLVVERGKRGLMVAPLDPERLLQLYQVRAALDALAAGGAARRHPSPAEAARLDAVVAEGRAAVLADDRTQLVRADAAFHNTVYELSGNAAIGETAGHVWAHFERGMHVVLQDDAYRGRAWEEHAAISAAIRAGDAGLAEKLAGEHARGAGEATAARLRLTRSSAA